MQPRIEVPVAPFCAALAVIGLCGGGAFAHAFNLFGTPAGAGLLVLTPILCVAIGWASARAIQSFWVALVLLCFAGGGLNGVAQLVLVHESSHSGWAFAAGVLASFAFLPPIVFVAVIARRIASVRSGSLLDALHRRSLVTSVTALVGVFAAIEQRWYPEVARVVLLPVLAIFAASWYLHGRTYRRIGCLRARRASSRATTHPEGQQTKEFVDLGIGDESWERTINEAGLRGAREIATVFAGDVDAASRALVSAFTLDLGMSLGVLFLALRFA